MFISISLTSQPHTSSPESQRLEGSVGHIPKFLSLNRLPRPQNVHLRTQLERGPTSDTARRRAVRVARLNRLGFPVRLQSRILDTCCLLLRNCARGGTLRTSALNSGGPGLSRLRLLVVFLCLSTRKAGLVSLSKKFSGNCDVPLRRTVRRNDLHSNSGGARFEYRPGYQLS